MSTSRIKGMTIDIGGDTSSFQNAMKKLEGSISKCQSSLKNINSALKLNPSSTVLLSNKQEILSAKIFETKEKLKTLQVSLAEVNKYAKENGGLTEEQYKKYINLTTEIEKTKSELKNLEGEYKNFGSVGAQVIKVVGQKTIELGNNITRIGEKLSKLSAISTAALGAITKTSIDFESAWTGVTKTVDGSEQELAKVRTEILKLASATGTSSSEIAGVAEAAGQLGVSVKDVSAFTETMVRLGDSTNLSAEEASTAIAQFYNIMQQDLSTVDRFGAALVDLGNNSATSESKIMDMASRIAGSASQIGLTSQQVMALATSLSSVGIEAEMGGSAISTVLTNIDKEVALNGKHLKTWAETAGMSAKEFKKLWATDTMSAIQAVVKGMGEVKSEGGNLNILLDELGVKNIRQTDTMKRLSNASDLLTNSLQIANSAWNNNSALANESQKRYETTAAKLAQVKETFKEIAIDLGEILLPSIKEFADNLKLFAEKFKGLDDNQKKMIINILKITAIIGPLVMAIGGLITKIGMFMTYAPQITSAFKNLKVIVTGVKTAFTGLGAIIGGISAPVLIVVGVIATLVTAFIILYKKCDWFRNGVNAILEKVKEGFIKFKNKIIEIFVQDIPQIWSNFINGIENLKNKITEGIENLGTNIRNIVQNIWNAIITFFTSTIPNFINSIIQWIQKIPYNLGYLVGYILGSLIKIAVAIGEFATVTLPKYIQEVIDWVGKLPDKIWEFLTRICSKIVEFATIIWEWISNDLPLIIQGIIDWFATLPDRIWKWLLNVIEKIIDWGTKTFNNAIQWTSKTINGIIDWFKQLPGKLWIWLTETLNKVKEWLQNMWDMVKEKVPQITQAIVDKFMELPGKMLEIGKNIVEGLWNGIKNAKDWLLGKVGEFAQGILDGMKNALGIHSPSTIFRDQVGKYIAEGIGVGFDKNIGSVVNDMQRKIGIETSKLSANVGLIESADSLNRVSPTTNNISIVVNAQTLNEESLEQAFVYINRKFGIVY